MAQVEPGSDPGPSPAPSLTDQLHALWRELPGLVSDRVELLSLELHRAVQALAQIIGLLVAVAVLGVTVWLVLWAAIIGLLVGAGMSLSAALLVAVVLNALAILAAVLRVRQLLPRLKLPATRRHLMVAPDLSPDPPMQEAPDGQQPATR